MIIRSVNALREHLKNQKSIGFVPTMGALHEGHLSLINQAKTENDCVVVSIFVNPTQFGPHEDFDRYPRNLERDADLAISAGATVIFAPSVKEIYPEGEVTRVIVRGHLPTQLCGASRPNHFEGVTTVVLKLLNIVTPERAYFGQKDIQQAIIIKQMVRDLYVPVLIVVCDIVRESDGLAMSSRNVYLSATERQQAVVLHQSLKKAEQLVKMGETSVPHLLELVVKEVNKAKLAKIDYVEIRDYHSLLPIEKIKGKVIVALAVHFGKTRLIDNIILEES